MRLVWDAWTAYLRRAAGYQSVVFLNIAYFAVLGPSVIVARLCGVRFLDRDAGPGRGYWVLRQPTRKTPVELRRQF
ncbi:MAG TPA: hypothetical protein VFB50_04270 [Chloroflexota bacterium]|nr:hypothetical protein [Chloroflexota bacterium]